jgi:hypothetical protein
MGKMCNQAHLSYSRNVTRNFLYTITAKFDKKYVVLADLETHVIFIENKKRIFEEDVFVKSYIIYRITTLTKE